MVLPFVQASNVTVFVYGPKTLYYMCGDRLTWFLSGWPKWTWFLCAGRKSFSLSVNIENNSGFMCVVEIELISVWGWKLTSFQCRGKFF